MRDCAPHGSAAKTRAWTVVATAFEAANYNAGVFRVARRATPTGKARRKIQRALLRAPRLLFLDEPTSSVDSNTEAMIVEALERLMHERTTVLISHRESTLRLCDVRIELARGEIISRAGT